MKVTLAVPYEGHEADSTITVDDHVGRQLIEVGRARLPDPKSAPGKGAESKAV